MLVAAAVDLVRAPLPERVGVADRVRLATVGEVVEHGRPDEVGAGLHLGDVDVLALAGAAPGLDGRQHGDGGGQPGGVVVEREAGPDVAPVGRVGEVRQPAQRVDRRGVGDHLRPRSLVARPAHRHVDDLRVPLPDLLVADAPAVEDAGREVLHQHVGLLDDAADAVERLGPLHVQRHQPLRAVPHVEVREVGRVDERRPLGGLELEDVGAEVAEDAVGERTGEHPREVDDAQAGERLAGGERPVVAALRRGRRRRPAPGPSRRAARRGRRATPAAAAARVTACRGSGRTAPASGPSSKPSTARNVPRNSYCGLAATWATVCTSPNAMCRRCASRNSSPESFVSANRRIAFITRGISASASSIVILASSAPSGSPSSAIHSNSGAGCGTGRDVARAVLGVGHDVGAEPVQRALAQRPLRDRQQVGEPPLEEQVLDRRRHDLVQREVDEAALAGLAGGVHAGEAADARHQRAERQVLATPRADGLVGRARDAEHAAQRAGDEIARLPVGARPGAAERRQRDLHQRRVGRREVVVVEAELGEAARRLRVDDEVGRARPGAGRRPRRRPCRGRCRPSACRPRTTSRAARRAPATSASRIAGPGDGRPMRATDAPLSARTLPAKRPLSSVSSTTRRPSSGPRRVLATFSPPAVVVPPLDAPAHHGNSRRGGSTPARGLQRRLDRARTRSPLTTRSRGEPARRTATVVARLPIGRPRAW